MANRVDDQVITCLGVAGVLPSGEAVNAAGEPRELCCMLATEGCMHHKTINTD